MIEDRHYVLDSIGDPGGDTIRLATHDDGDTCRITCTHLGAASGQQKRAELALRSL